MSALMLSLLLKLRRLLFRSGGRGWGRVPRKSEKWWPPGAVGGWGRVPRKSEKRGPPPGRSGGGAVSRENQKNVDPPARSGDGAVSSENQTNVTAPRRGRGVGACHAKISNTLSLPKCLIGKASSWASAQLSVYALSLLKRRPD